MLDSVLIQPSAPHDSSRSNIIINKNYQIITWTSELPYWMSFGHESVSISRSSLCN